MMQQVKKTLERVHRRFLLWGVAIGSLIGAVVALFTFNKKATTPAEQINELQRNVRQKIETAKPADPVAESLAEGKAAARRRRSELGMDP